MGAQDSALAGCTLEVQTATQLAQTGANKSQTKTGIGISRRIIHRRNVHSLTIVKNIEAHAVIRIKQADDDAACLRMQPHIREG